MSIPSSPSQKTRFRLIVGLDLLIFAFDLYVVDDTISIGFLYIIPMILTFTFDNFRYPVIIGALSTTLITIGTFIPMPPEGQLLTVVANRLVAIVMVCLCLSLTRYRLLFIAGLHRTIADERAKAAAQRAFVAMISHEFRTPLTSIDGHAQQLILSGPSQPFDSITRRAQKIRGAVERILQLVESILHAERLEQARLSYRPVDFDLGSLVRDLCRRQTEAAPGHAIDLALPETPLRIHGDPSLIEHALGNLLANAVKFSAPPSQIAVEARLEDGQAVVAVRDLGIGIPEADQPRLFERYFRAGNALRTPGSGVGLHLARDLIRDHGGEITVESRENHGSRFTVRLPLAPNGSTRPT